MVNPTRMVNAVPQKVTPRRVKSHQQMITALELRASGASYLQIGRALSVSKTRAYRIVRAGLDEYVVTCRETADSVRHLEMLRLNRMIFALTPRASDYRVANVLVKISARIAKLYGLDAPQRIETTGKEGGPIETKQTEPDSSKLTLAEKLRLEELQRKALGLPERSIDEAPYTRKW